MSKKELIDQIIGQFRVLTYNIENHDNSEKKLLTENLLAREDLKHLELTLTEYHIIACIGDNEKANGTIISKALNISNAGVYKNTTKLIEKQLIETCRLPNNRKEVHYVLSKLGEVVYDMHQSLHTLAEQQFVERLNLYLPKELRVITKFLSDFYNEEQKQ